MEILAEGAGNMEFLSTLDAQNGFSGGQWADFLDEGGIDQG